MSDVNLPGVAGATRAMLEMAKKDGPSAAARAKVWGGVASTVGCAAAASGTVSATAATTGGVSAAKMLALGTLLGASLSVGLAVTVLYMGQAPRGGEEALGARAPATAEARPERAKSQPPAAAAATAAATTAPRVTATATPHAVKRQAGSPDGRVVPPVNALAREASLVAGARSSLANADPRAALQAIHEARGLSSRQLGPEELAVEAQALRALGREDEANETDLALKAQFPESALAR
jgi:hypothetical protein